MLYPGLYEQVINNALTSELAEIPELARLLRLLTKPKLPRCWRSIWRMWFRRGWITYWTTAGVFQLKSSLPIRL